jgi:glycosyltransferase involved in cell wall biosynthesis
MPKTSTNNNRPSCTAIVCAYNEERTVAGVLFTLLESPLVDEIIVVDDGSDDNTAAVIHRFDGNQKVRPFFLPENRGKGYAMAIGITHAHGETLLFVDADLLNLTSAHISMLLRPWQDGEADMIIGHRIRIQGITKFRSVFGPLSGERVLFRRDVVPLIPSIENSRFGVETIINLHYRRQGKRVRYVLLKGLIHPIKIEKAGLGEAVSQYANASLQIAQATARHYPPMFRTTKAWQRLDDWKQRYRQFGERT